jgi:hypothetical protein
MLKTIESKDFVLLANTQLAFMNSALVLPITYVYCKPQGEI